MKTEEELNNDILTITMKISETFPELMKYIGEMPMRVSDGNGTESNIKNLSDYYASLEALLKNYMPNHQSTLK